MICPALPVVEVVVQAEQILGVSRVFLIDVFQ
jgi:hypothetical protein